MTLSVDFERPNLAVLRVQGVLQRAEVDAVKRQVHAHMQAHGQLHVLVHIDSGFASLEAFASWDDIPEDALIQRNVIRLAITGDMRWRDTAVLFFLNAVSRFPMDYFKPDHEELARAWLLQDQAKRA